MHWSVWAVGGGVLVGVVAALAGGGSSSSSSTTTTGNYPMPKPQPQGVPFAAGALLPVFPIAPSSKHKRRLQVSYRDVEGKVHGNWGRRFKASRDDRWHVGVDLFANAGDVVLAPEAGIIVGTQNFLSSIPYDDAFLIEGASGVTVLLGEVQGRSWRDFGLEVGSVVSAGQPVARVGLTQNGSHMLHLETYRAGVKNNQRWYKGKPPPPDVLDPTDYLLRAAAREVAFG